MSSRAFTLAIVDPNPLSRAGIRSALQGDHADGKLAVAWEAQSYGEAILALEGLTPDVLILSLAEYDSELIPFLRTLSQRFAGIRKLLIGPDPNVPSMCNQLLKAGLDGFVVREEVSISISDAVFALLHDAHYFSKCIVANLVQTPTLTQLVNDLQTSFYLTPREQEVFRLTASGLSNIAIAKSLGISERTVRLHLRSICDKAGVDSLFMAILKLLISWHE